MYLIAFKYNTYTRNDVIQEIGFTSDKDKAQKFLAHFQDQLQMVIRTCDRIHYEVTEFCGNLRYDGNIYHERYVHTLKSMDIDPKMYEFVNECTDAEVVVKEIPELIEPY